MAEETKREFTFPAPKKVREFKTITIREIDGTDEEIAATWAGQRGKSDMRSLFNEQVVASIAAVDGEKVGVNGVRFSRYDNWSTIARTAVQRFYNEVNGIDNGELDLCVGVGMGLLPPPSQAQAPSDSSAKPNGG